MAKLNIQTVNSIPSPAEASTIYFLKNGSSFEIYISDINGNVITQNIPTPTPEVADQSTIIGVGTSADPFRIPDVLCVDPPVMEERELHTAIYFYGANSGARINFTFNGQPMTINNATAGISMAANGDVTYTGSNGWKYIRFNEKIVNGVGDFQAITVDHDLYTVGEHIHLILMSDLIGGALNTSGLVTSYFHGTVGARGSDSEWGTATGWSGSPNYQIGDKLRLSFVNGTPAIFKNDILLWQGTGVIASSGGGTTNIPFNQFIQGLCSTYAANNP